MEIYTGLIKEISNSVYLIPEKNIYEFITLIFEKSLKSSNIDIAHLNSDKKVVFLKDNKHRVLNDSSLYLEMKKENKDHKFLKKQNKNYIFLKFKNEKRDEFFIISSKKDYKAEAFFFKSVILTCINIYNKFNSPLFNKEDLKNLILDEEMYRGVFEYTGTGTIIINHGMFIEHSNQKFSELTGYSKQEIENKMKWSDFVAPVDYEMLLKYHYGRRRFDPSIPEEYECRILDKEKNLKYIYMKVGMIPGTDKSIASFMDITTRKTAEMKLKGRESQLSLIVENFDGLIYIVNKDYEIEFMNKSRKKNGEILKCYNFIHGFDSPCPWCSIKKAFAGEIVRAEIFNKNHNKWYSSVTSPLLTFPEKITSVQTILTDITERKLNEKKLKESAENLKNENLKLKSSIKERFRLGDIIGKSSKMQEVYELILKAAESNAHVIVSGDSGTGKELAAREIHRLSSRSKENFVPVNCGAISERLIESEFFGYKKGAFTGADTNKKGFLDKADKGTLFLDEIGEIGLNMQVKLLRAIDDAGYTPVGATEVKKSDLRIIAATNRDLKELVKGRLMREDFFYRIHVIPIRLPSLKERKEDIQILAEHFVASMGIKGAKPHLSGRVMDAFLKYSWPGNIRELQNVLNRYVAIGDISPLDETFGKENSANDDLTDINRPLSDIMAEFEERVILKALEKNRWHKQKTAEFLGLHRKTLFQKIKKYNIG